jgi:hypothetical protein
MNNLALALICLGFAAPALAETSQQAYDSCMADAQMAGIDQATAIGSCQKAEGGYDDCMADARMSGWSDTTALPICVGAKDSYNDCMADESMAGVTDKHQAILTCTGNN